MFTIELDDDGLQARLEGIVAEMGDLTPLMRDIGEYLTASTRDRFAAGEAPDGSSWAPKSAATTAAYAARGDRVDMRPLFGPSGMLSAQLSYAVTPDSVEFGSSMVYAAMMQFGGTKAAFPHLWGDIPARPFIGLSDRDREEIGAIIDDWLAGIIDAAR